MSRIDKELIERRAELSAAVAIISAVLVAILLSQLTRPIVIFDGWTASGTVGFFSYDLRVAENPVRVPPLSSVTMVSIFFTLLLISALLSSAVAAYGYFSRKELVMIEASAASAFAAALSVALLISIVRVVAQILSVLDDRVIPGSAGRLYIDPPSLQRSMVFIVQEYPIITLITVAALFVAGIVLAYIAYRLGSQLERGAADALKGEAGAAEQIDAP